MIRMAMRVDHVRDRQSLIARALNEHLGRVRRIDQHALSRIPITEQIAKVAVATGTELFEDELHPSIASRAIAADQLAAKQ